MISWGVIGYGAALSAVLAGASSPASPAGRITWWALVAGLAAFLIDVYLY